jgi:hypothetical protein
LICAFVFLGVYNRIKDIQANKNRKKKIIEASINESNEIKVVFQGLIFIHQRLHQIIRYGSKIKMNKISRINNYCAIGYQYEIFDTNMALIEYTE